ncbi:hypothetical protein AVEN_23358-1 [Araneus ventricosus]|uniref:Uncharacterized protein n=1 Tax=Araneus ventricosus TaxID=182803 RepID=A0A4Y2MZW9_ARAVE|nr:hypothetical protein AVEN_23358-1 [Araneus ventricosus]
MLQCPRVEFHLSSEMGPSNHATMHKPHQEARLLIYMASSHHHIGGAPLSGIMFVKTLLHHWWPFARISENAVLLQWCIKILHINYSDSQYLQTYCREALNTQMKMVT